MTYHNENPYFLHYSWNSVHLSPNLLQYKSVRNNLLLHTQKRHFVLSIGKFASIWLAGIRLGALHKVHLFGLAATFVASIILTLNTFLMSLSQLAADLPLLGLPSTNVWVISFESSHSISENKLIFGPSCLYVVDIHF